MSVLREYADLVLTGLLVMFVLALVAGQLLGQPVLLGYVTTDSMTPTLEPGDGFVAVPQGIAGDPEPGDVVVFEARELHDGGLTTHRIVGETEEGYVTKGDANPFTDQDGGEPPVRDDRIVAQPLQVGGDVVAIPEFGTGVMAVQETVLTAQRRIASALGTRAVLGAQGVGLLLFGLGFLLFGASIVGELHGGETRSRRRSRRLEGVLDSRWVVVVLLVVVLLPANVAMVGSSGVHEVVVDGDAAAKAGLEPGDSVAHEFTATNEGLVAMFVVVETEDESALIVPSELELAAGESTTATLTLPAPQPAERRTVAVSEHRYLLLLPPSVLATLHARNPIFAWGAINLLIACSVFGLVGSLLGIGRYRVRKTSRGRPLRIRVRRWFR